MYQLMLVCVLVIPLCAEIIFIVKIVGIQV